MNYTIYDSTSGQIIGYVYAETDNDAAENLKNCSFVDGKWDANKYYIHNNQAVDIPLRPSDDDNCRFDYTIKQWRVIKPVLTSEQLRDQRNQLLIDVDRINPVWYASLDSEQQQQLQQYRQLLLAVPQQPGFPESVEWPAKPTWL